MRYDDPVTFVQGSTDQLWARTTDRFKTDLSGEVIQLRTKAPDGTFTAWAPPDYTELSEAATGVVEAGIDYTATVVGIHELQMKVGPTILKVGPFQVVAP